MSLLPSNATPFQLGLEHAQSHICLLETDVSIVTNAEKAPIAYLPFLAWEQSVDEWNDEWDTQTKRNVINAAPSVHRHKGTVGAIKEAVQAIGSGVDVQEWYEYNGQPYTFRVVLDDGDNLTPEQQAEILRVVRKTKNLRSQFTGIFSSQTITAHINMGAAPSSLTFAEVEPLRALNETLSLNSYSAAWPVSATYVEIEPAQWQSPQEKVQTVSTASYVAAAPTTRKAVTVYPADSTPTVVPPGQTPDPDAGPVIQTAGQTVQLVGGTTTTVGEAVTDLGEALSESSLPL